MLMGPGFGRLLPMPLLAPWAWEATFLCGLIFPIAGAVSDLRHSRRVHPAWAWGILTMLAAFVTIELITYSGVGKALYETVTADSAGAGVAPLGFPPPPAGPLVTGR